MGFGLRSVTRNRARCQHPARTDKTKGSWVVISDENLAELLRLGMFAKE